MVKASRLVALTFVGSTDSLTVVNADTSRARRKIGVGINKSRSEWKYSGDTYPVGTRRTFELDNVKGVIGVYNTRYNSHLTAMTHDKRYAELAKFERNQDHD